MLEKRVVLMSAGIRRQYLLLRPRRVMAPLVIFLHGSGATAQWADEETGWSSLASNEGFALAIPDGIRPDPESRPRFLTNPQRWNDGSPTGLEKQSAPDDVAFLAAIIEDARTKSAIDTRCVYVSGFSSGAAMAFRAAAELADRITAVAPVAGYCWQSDPKPSRPVPTLYLHGSLDRLVPYRGGEVRSPWQHRFVRRPPVTVGLEVWAKAIGCEPTPRLESDTGIVRTDTYPGPVQFRVLTIEGLGHHWPGGKGRLNPRLAGPPSDTVNGTELAWEFFKQHRL